MAELGWSVARIAEITAARIEGGGDLAATADLPRMANEIARLNPEDARQLPRLMRANRGKLESFRPVLESPFLGWTSLLAPKLLKSLRWLRPHRSVDADLASEPPPRMLAGEFARGRVVLDGPDFGGVRAERVAMDLDPFGVDMLSTVLTGNIRADEPLSGRLLKKWGLTLLP